MSATKIMSVIGFEPMKALSTDSKSAVVTTGLYSFMGEAGFEPALLAYALEFKSSPFDRLGIHPFFNPIEFDVFKPVELNGFKCDMLKL